MTENKALKRATRARMAKTGERYTAARRHLVAAPDPQPAAPDAWMPDESVRKGSGKGWDEWLRILDDWGATKRTHGEIARYLGKEHGVSGWWSQSVAAGYELARGMRERYKRPDGYEVSVSKTFPVSADALFAEMTEARRRNAWLDRGTLRMRTTQPGKTARFDFNDGESRVHAYFVAKGHEKSTLTIQHAKLAEEAGVEKMRAFWKDRLAALAERLK